RMPGARRARSWAHEGFRSWPMIKPGTNLLLVVLLLRRRLRGIDLSKTRKILGFHLRRRAVLAADGVIYFFAVDADLFRGIDPQTNLVAADVYHGDLDIVSDHDRLVPLSGQHQHAGSFLGNPTTRDFRFASSPAGSYKTTLSRGDLPGAKFRCTLRISIPKAVGLGSLIRLMQRVRP